MIICTQHLKCTLCEPTTINKMEKEHCLACRQDC